MESFRNSLGFAVVQTAFVMAWQEGWFQQEDSKEVWSWPRRRWSCYSAWDSDSYRRDDPPCGWSGSRKRRERRMFADHIAQQLATLLDRQDKIDNTMVTMASEMKELMSQCVFGSGQQSYSWNHPYFHASWEAIPGPTHFVEIPVVKITEKVIEVPRFIEKVASCGGEASLEPQAEKTATAGRWESMVRRSLHIGECARRSDALRRGRDDLANERVMDAEKIDAWTPFDKSAGTLTVGDVVRVERRFASGDEVLQIMLTKGVKGVVEHLDEDGDAQVRFPALSGLRCTLRWVLAADFAHLSRLTASDAAESAAA